MLSDPLLVNVLGLAVEDFYLLPTSPAINAGIDVGRDVNGSAAGNYNGSAPDIGFFESVY